MIKGHVQIDLHNHKSGSKERIEQDNLVTNSVGRLCDFLIGRGFGYASSNPKIFPLITKALGGLLIFEDPLTESATNMRFPYDNFVTGYAGQSLNTDDAERGSLNSNESGPVENGYCTVWDFSTSQANGQVSSLALTHTDVDMNGPIWASAVKDNIRYSYGGMEVNSVKYHDNYIYYVDTTNDKLMRRYLPTTNYLVSDIIGVIGQPEEVASSVFDSSNKRWIDGGNGKYYALESCTYDTSTNPATFKATIEAVLASSNVYQGEYVIQFTASDIVANQFYSDNNYGNSIGNNFFASPVIISDGILYLKRSMRSAEEVKIYTFDLSTHTPGTYTLVDDDAPTGNLICTIPMVDTIPEGYEASTYRYGLFRGNVGACVMPIFIRYLDTSSNWQESIRLYVIKPDGGYKAYSRKVTSNLTNNYISTLLPESDNLIDFTTMTESRAMYLPANYLGTICNLESSFEKTNTTSMKVKYTLTNV